MIRRSIEELESFEIRPFAELRTDFIMPGHILVPALDPKNCITLSKKALTYLRERLGFKGVIVSDSLVMDGLLKQCASVEEAAIKAISAGCDIVLLGGKLLQGANKNKELTILDIRRIHHALVDAVKEGRISIDASVDRILAAKRRLAPAQEGNFEQHEKLARAIAEQSVKIIKSAPLDLTDKKIAFVTCTRFEENPSEQQCIDTKKERI